MALRRAPHSARREDVPHEVSTRYLPLATRFAEVRVDAVHLGRSGMDVDEDVRRSEITTESVFETAVETAEVYDRTFADTAPVSSTSPGDSPDDDRVRCGRLPAPVAGLGCPEEIAFVFA